MRVLLAEDDAISRRVAEAFLQKWGYEVISVGNGVDALALLEPQTSPRLAILDWMMPGMEGVEVCRRVRALAGHPYVYLVLLTARGKKQSLLEGLESGADDYLSKPFDSDELRARLKVGERILFMQDELISARDALHFRVSHDALTGAASRCSTLDTLLREMARGARESRPLGVVLADIDHFKTINDTHGHLVGDAVLEEIASRMMKSVRTYDSVGRYGGEEFLIVLPSATEEGAGRQAERIRRAIEAAPVRAKELSIAVTASFGVAATEGSLRDDISTLLRTVDAALYRAKSLGRNRVIRASSLHDSSTVAPASAH